MSRARDLADGTFSTDLSVISGASTYALIDSDGLKFNGDTAAANALDDYEEGTWTVALTSSGTDPTHTVVDNYGYYTKVGRLVLASFKFYATGVSGGTSDIRISGLPFTSNTNTTNYRSSGSVSFFRGVTHYGSWLTPHLSGNRTYLTFYREANSTEFDTSITTSNLSSAVAIQGVISYMTS